MQKKVKNKVKISEYFSRVLRMLKTAPLVFKEEKMQEKAKNLKRYKLRIY